MIYKSFIKPLLFTFPAEKAHHLTTSLFSTLLAIPLLSSLVRKSFSYEDPSLEKEVFGIKFPNPVGLAAGFDKDGKYYRSMSALGFGFIEIGTVTPVGQDGNPQPRLFRLPEDKGLINRMGFNNEGVEAMAERLEKYGKQGVIIGGNIGKNKLTPNEEAYKDYELCFEKLYPLVDYFVVNVSSPNTPGLRALQAKEPLTKLLQHLMKLRAAHSKKIPVLLKIAPDLGKEEIDDVLDIVKEVGLDGLIATNTTINRNGLSTSDDKIQKIGNGGLSGEPLRQRSLEVISYLRSQNPTLPIIGVGGISQPEHALRMLEAGADLVQIYSGLVYSGPSLIKNTKKLLKASQQK